MDHFIINIYHLDLEYSDNIYDRVDVQFQDVLTMGTGATVNEASTLAILGGTSFTNPIVIPGPSMWISFTSDNTVTRTGFALQVHKAGM